MMPKSATMVVTEIAPKMLEKAQEKFKGWTKGISQFKLDEDWLSGE
jgi:hypothetical protein